MKNSRENKNDDGMRNITLETCDEYLIYHTYI